MTDKHSEQRVGQTNAARNQQQERERSVCSLHDVAHQLHLSPHPTASFKDLFYKPNQVVLMHRPIQNAVVFSMCPVTLCVWRHTYLRRSHFTELQTVQSGNTNNSLKQLSGKADTI